MAIVIGGFWFWTLIILAFGMITFFVEYERKSNGWLALLAFCAGLWVFLAAQGWSNWKAISGYVIGNPAQVVGIIAIYITVGFLWSLYKWTRFVKQKQKDAIDHVNAAYDGEMSTWNRAPKASDHVEDILLWMSYWPFSIWWRFLQDPVRWIFTKVFEFFEFQFDQISSSKFKEVEKLSEAKKARYLESKRSTE